MADKKISQLTASTTPLAGVEELAVVQSGVTKKASVENILTSTQPSGTANGVVYLNGSKIATSGSALTFNGTALSTTGNIQASGSGNKAISATSDGGVAYLALGSVGVGTQYLYGNVGGSQNFVAEVGGLERFRVDVNNVTVNTGNLIIGTSGKGIDFSADGQAAGMTSELLDDYEEGTWTPNLGGNEVLSSVSGLYTKIGNSVTVSFKYTVTTIGSGSTQTISGLPYTTNALICGGSISYFANSFTSVTSMSIRTNASATTLQLQALTAAGATIQNVDINQNGTVVYGTITYFV